MWERQPDRTELLPAWRDAVEDAARDHEVAPRIVTAEGQAEMMIVNSDQHATGRGDRRDGDRERAPRGRYNHPFILWGDLSTASRPSRSCLARRDCSSWRSWIRRSSRCPKSTTCC